jgi:hypothetical protein
MVPDCRLIIIDPISAYMGGVDSHKNSEVRGLLGPLTELATEKNVAIVAISHLTKGDAPPMQRLMGSMAFVAAARAVWFVVRDKLDDRRRMLLPLKNNLADDVTGLAFRIDSKPVVCWEREAVTTSIEDAMAAEPRKRGPATDKKGKAADWLRGILADGPKSAKAIYDLAKAAGFTERTCQRAFREEVKGHYGRDSFGGPNLWSLTPFPPSEPRHQQPGGTVEIWRDCDSTDSESPEEEFGVDDDIWRSSVIHAQKSCHEQSRNGHVSIPAKIPVSGDNLASLPKDDPNSLLLEVEDESLF